MIVDLPGTTTSKISRKIMALREQGGNKTKAAKVLGLTREGLHKKLRLLGMS